MNGKMNVRVSVGGYGRPSAGRSALPKRRTYLSAEFESAMKALRIKGLIRDARTRRDVNKNETPAFIAYLTLALENLSNIIGVVDGLKVDLSGCATREKVIDKIEKSGKLFELASFLWIFREGEPQFNYGRIRKEGEERDYAKFAKAIVLKLWELRNMFVHSTRQAAASVLVVEPAFYRFVEGELYSEARENALGPGRKSEKIFKLKLFTPHNDQNTKYEFTRKGIIFLICLALYRHDANEFIQRFPDMQLPPREWEMEKENEGKRCLKDDPKNAYSIQELVDLRRKGGSVKAILDAFTYFSMRASRTDIDIENVDYLNFANILLYLNKVPKPAYDYLALKTEADRLVAEEKDSTESTENKRFKYVLQSRKKDRFLTLALAYLEDFNCLPSLKFKRLDITVRPERKRYLFGRIPEGKPNEFGDVICDANGMDRHYAIVNGNAQFEFVPVQHYGSVRIARLRGAIGEDEIMRLLLVIHAEKRMRRQDPNRAIEDYLTAYHRILERMLNTQDLSELTLDDGRYRADFKTVSGKDDAALEPSVFVERMKPFFSASVTRYFVGQDLRPDEPTLQKTLGDHLAARRDRARDTLARLDHLTEWRALDPEARAAAELPVCKIGELRFPPRTFRFNDGQLAQMVLDFLNFYLRKEEKFRQLPRGMRHRGVKDFEFQLLHTDIGRFGIDPQRLWRTLELRESLNGEGGPLEALRNREGELFREEQRRCRGRLDRNGKPLRVGHTLTMLAYAATELLAEGCEEARQTWTGPLADEDRELLPFVAPMYGVKAGQDLDRAALVKTVLGIDLDSWSHAFDYATGKNFDGRDLASAKELIAAQIPMPNDFARRCVAQPAEGVFQFNPAFRAFKPYGEMSLRDYYDVKPLIEAVRKLDVETKRLARIEDEHARANAPIDPTLPGLEARVRPPRDEKDDGGERDFVYGKAAPGPREFSRSVVNKAIQSIQRIERQDKVLLACAKAYWERYMASEVMSSAKSKILKFDFSGAKDIREFFTLDLVDEVKGEKVRMMPNDFARPAYSAVTEHIKELVGRTSADKNGVYSFYDLWLALRDLQRKENAARLDLLAADVKFTALVESSCTPIPNFKDLSDEEKRAALFPQYQKGTMGIARDPVTKEVVPLAREEFDIVYDLSPRLRHPSGKGETLLGQDLESAKRVYRRFGCLTAMK